MFTLHCQKWKDHSNDVSVLSDTWRFCSRNNTSVCVHHRGVNMKIKRKNSPLPKKTFKRMYKNSFRCKTPPFTTVDIFGKTRYFNTLDELVDFDCDSSLGMYYSQESRNEFMKLVKSFQAEEKTK